MLSEFRFAFRTLAKSPAYTFLAIITIAFGIGASTAVFSMVEGVLLRPLPYASNDRRSGYSVKSEITSVKETRPCAVA